MAKAFDPRDVTLLDSPFTHARDLDAAYLLELEPDRFLAWFRKEAGLESRAEVYPGWESRGIAGHSVGHYLSACAMMFRSTGDVRFRERIEAIVEEFAVCQEANGSGYIGAIPDGENVLGQIRHGDIRSQGFDLNGLWVPFYTIHKILAGLRDAYRLTGNEQALEVETRFADWIDELLADLTHDQMQRVLAAEFGGMNEVLADLYVDTGEKHYLALAERFHHEAVMEPLSQQRDNLAGLHANTQIPKLVGAARLYEISGDESHRQLASFFWERVTRHHSYANGGNSMAEHFGPPDRLSDRLSESTAETCNVYNMLKLSDHLFRWQPRGDIGDFMERALYGQILASQHPKHGTTTYFMSLAQGGHKEYDTLHDRFTCCVGTGMENHARYSRGIYYEADDRLFINLFVPSELHWREKGVRVRMETAYPESGLIRVMVSGEPSGDFAIFYRVPHWAEDSSVVLNGVPLNADESTSPGFHEVRANWKDGDVLEIRLPMALRAEAMPDNPQRVALFHGPLLLAGDLGPVDDPRHVEPDFVPAIVTEGEEAAAWLKRDGESEMRFALNGVGRPRDVELIPFHRMHDRRTTVYWDVFTPAQWSEKEAEYREERQRRTDMEARTVDQLQPGEMQPERDHNQRGENTEAGAFAGRKFRHALDGGWFSYEMTCDPDAPHALIVTYYGGETGERTFDILIDGRRLIREKLYRDAPDRFFDQEYLIPEWMTRGKESITIRFQAHPGNWAGGVYGVRMVRAEVARDE